MSFLLTYLDAEAETQTQYNQLTAENFLGTGEFVTLCGLQPHEGKIYAGIIPMGLSQYGANIDAQWQGNSYRSGKWVKKGNEDLVKTQNGGAQSSAYKRGELQWTQYPDSCHVAIFADSRLSSPKVIKTDPERVKTILYIALQLVANLATAFAPFLPFSSERLRRMLKLQTLDWSRLGQTDLLPAGHQIDQAELLFEKIEDEVVMAQVEKLKAMEAANEAAEKKAEPISAETTIDEFAKMDLRVGTVLSCERVPKSDKLLQFKIDDGLGGRTIVSGIAKFYEPEQLVGKQVVFIANLPPRKLRGIVSEGMILSAQNLDGSLSVLTIDRSVAPGAQVG